MKIAPPRLGKHVLPSTDFRMRYVDFGRFNKRSFSISPYQPVGAGIAMGFEESAKIVARTGKVGNGSRALFIEVRPGESRWITLELDLDTSGVEKSGHASINLAAAASTRLHVSAALRVPTKGPQKFIDSHSERFTLVAQVKNYPLVIGKPDVEIIPNHDQKCPRIVLFLPVREATYCFQKLTISPAAS